MFFIFQLIGNPAQPYASLFRANIQKAVTVCEQATDTHIASKALNILKTLSPLYSAEFLSLNEVEKQNERARTMSIVRTLAFPYHESKFHRPFAESPMTTNLGTPVSSMRDSLLDQQPSRLDNSSHSSSRTEDDFSQSVFVTTSAPRDQYSVVPLAPPFASLPPYSVLPDQKTFSGTSFGSEPNDEMVWGASLGFSIGEWETFLDMMHPPDYPEQ